MGLGMAADRRPRAYRCRLLTRNGRSGALVRRVLEKSQFRFEAVAQPAAPSAISGASGSLRSALSSPARVILWVTIGAPCRRSSWPRRRFLLGRHEARARCLARR